MSNGMSAPDPPQTLLTASRRELILRRAKVGVLQARRLLWWTAAPESWQRPDMAGSAADFPHRIYHHESSLARTDPGADPTLDQGKRINVALAAPHFDGLVLSPETPLSFWRTLGRCTAARGFRPGMELRGGCIVPTLGGGLCRLSNALFGMACELGWTIIERHGHTMEATPPLPDEPVWGLDATVLWPHVDLRVAPRHEALRLGVQVTGDHLIIQVHSTQPSPVRALLHDAGDVIYQHQGQRIRANQVVRRLFDRTTGALLSREVVAVNRRRLLHSQEQRRNCLSCAEDACLARPHRLARKPAMNLAKNRAGNLADDGAGKLADDGAGNLAGSAR
jgi:vancomycin resistance protein VanW